MVLNEPNFVFPVKAFNIPTSFEERMKQARTMVDNDSVEYFDYEIEGIDRTSDDDMSLLGYIFAFGSSYIILRAIEVSCLTVKSYIESDGYHPVYYLVNRKDLTLSDKKHIITKLSEVVGKDFFDFSDAIITFSNLCFAYGEYSLEKFVKELIPDAFDDDLFDE